jgi:putative hemolysin
MDPDPSGSYLNQIILLIILILINAFFAMAEMATVSANRSKIKNLAEQGKKNAVILEGLFTQPNKFLSTIQVMITLAGFLQSALAATAMSGDLGSWLNYVIPAMPLDVSVQVAMVIITFVLSYFNLVFGELVPKRVALHHSERLALFTARPIYAFSIITKPFVWLLSVSVNFVLKLFRIYSEESEEQYSEEEIKSLLEVGQETGLINESNKEMITSVFEFDDKLAYEVMTPRTDVLMFNINEPISENIDEILNSRYSRIPFYDKDNDDIVGLLILKDYIIKAKKQGWNKVSIRKIMKKPFFVPESKKIDELFDEMQSTKIHMAFLIDEYGGVSGIVTLEDLVEEVMGNIDDEYDDYEPKLEKVKDNEYIMDGSYYLDDLNEELGLNFISDDYETIAGLLIDELGEIPDDKEKDPAKMELDIDHCHFKIIKVKDRRIEQVGLTINESDADEDEEQTKHDKRDKAKDKDKVKEKDKSKDKER